MVTPVQQQPPLSASQPPGSIPSRAPAGVGSAPTTLQGKPPAEIAYVERLVMAIKDFITWLFSKIFFWFKKEDAPAPQPSAEPDLRPQRHEILQRLENTYRSDQLLVLFQQHFSDEEKNCIYGCLGRSAPSFWDNPASVIERGKGMVEKEPSLILPHLIQKMKSLL